MPFTVEERELKFRQFIKLKAKGRKQSAIRRDVGISINTFYEWWQIDEEEELFLTVQRPGGRHRTTTDEDDESLRAAALHHNWNGFNALRNAPELLENESLQLASNRVIRTRLREQGVRRRVAAVKERLHEHHRISRLNYANEMIQWDVVDWSRIIFIDEFRIESGDHGRIWVWRENGTRFDENNIVTVDHTHRISVSFILFFSFYGLGDLYINQRLTKETYAEFLEECVLTHIADHYEDGVVMLLHDNHPAHTSNYVKDWINTNIGNVKDFVVPHPSLSPDLNPDENVGAMLKSLVHNERSVIDTEEDLIAAITAAHTKLRGVSYREFFINLVESMPRRMAAIRASGGGPTRY